MAKNSARLETENKLIEKAAQDADFKARLLSDPKAIIAEETGGQLPDNLEITVLEESANQYYLVLPLEAQESEELSEEALEAVAGGGGNVILPNSVVSCW